MVKPNSEVEILKEVISNGNNKFSGDITINCPAGVNKIKAVGYDYKGDLKIDKSKDVLFTYTNNKWSGKKWHDKKRSDEKFI